MEQIPKIEAYRGDGEYIFISYAHKDKEIVYPFIEALQKKYNVWFDEAINYGSEWEEVIYDKLEGCSLLMFFATKNSVVSSNCRDELYNVRELDKPFINIISDETIEYPKWFKLRYARPHHCNYYSFSSPSDAVADLEKNCTWFDAVKSDDFKKDISTVKETVVSAPQLSNAAIKLIETAKLSYAEQKKFYESQKSDGSVSLISYKNAVADLTKLADQGDTNAQIASGFCYYFGIGVTMDYGKATEYYSKAADKGNVYAEQNLGNCYYYGDCNKTVPPRYGLAAEWYAKAAKKGYAEAEYYLAFCYKLGDGVPMNYKKALELFLKAAEQRHVKAMMNVGTFYYYGNGVEVNYDEAVKWYQRSADQGYDDAQFRLGYCYHYGEGVPQNYEKAVYWYEKAADQGNKDAQCNLGYLYDEGLGVPQSYEKAVYWYEKAADQGNKDAQNNLGYQYEKGQGVPQSYEKAVYWYEKAAEQNYSTAIENLAIMYDEGTGVPQDHAKAEELRKRAEKLK